MGFFVASFVWLFVAPFGAGSWRYMYLLGVLPALLTLWIRRAIPESHLWEKAKAERVETEQKFTLVELFSDPALRRRTIIVFLMSLTTTIGFWGISTWVPPFIGQIAADAGLPAQTWASYAGMAYTAGSVLGYITLGFIADAYGRKPVTIAFFVLALIMTPVLFFWTRNLPLLLVLACINGAFTCGQYTWMPVWLPELYPTRIRATAMGFAFNGPRFIAFLGPLVAGTLIVQMGGYGQAAMLLATVYVLGIAVAPLLPETRGKPLPA
jgi:MFS family permease